MNRFTDDERQRILAEEFVRPIETLNQRHRREIGEQEAQWAARRAETERTERETRDAMVQPAPAPLDDPDAMLIDMGTLLALADEVAAAIGATDQRLDDALRRIEALEAEGRRMDARIASLEAFVGDNKRLINLPSKPQHVS